MKGTGCPGEQAASVDLLWVIIGGTVLVLASLVLLILWLVAANNLRKLRARPTVVTAVDGASPQVIEELITLSDLTTSPSAQAQVERTLRRAGVERLDASPGQAFQANIHNAAGTRPTENTSAVNTIAEIVHHGWRAGQRVIRPTEVIVWIAEPIGGSR